MVRYMKYRNQYLNASEGLHPFVEVDDSVSTDIDEIEEIFDDREAGDGMGGQFGERDDEFVELVEGHSSCIVLVELELLR